MGGIREDFGRITIESRRESFIVHASYGLRDARKPRAALMPGDYFREVDADPRKQIPILYVAYIEVAHAHGRVSGSTRALSWPRDDVPVIPCDEDGRALDQEEDPLVTSFTVLWKDRPHPEFELRDLSDLIAALEELRNNPR